MCTHTHTHTQTLTNWYTHTQTLTHGYTHTHTHNQNSSHINFNTFLKIFSADCRILFLFCAILDNFLVDFFLERNEKCMIFQFDALLVGFHQRIHDTLLWRKVILIWRTKEYILKIQKNYCFYYLYLIGQILSVFISMCYKDL